MARRKPDALDFASAGAHNVGEIFLPQPATDEELGITERDLPAATSTERHTLDAILDDLIAYQDTLAMATTDEDQAAIESAIVERQSQLIAKVPRYVGAMRRLEFEANWEKEESKRHTRRMIRYEEALRFLKEYAISAMQRRGIRKLEGQGAALKLRQSPGQLLVTDAVQVPNDYKTVTVTIPRELWIRMLKEIQTETLTRLTAMVRETIDIRKDLAKRDIKAGAEVPGADVVFPDLLEVE